MIRRNVRLLLCLAAAAILVLTGCSSGEIINEASTAQSFSLSCEKLTQTREIKISVGDSASATLNAAIDHNGGSLSLLIADTQGDVIYSGSDIASATSFMLMLEGPAEYTISIATNRYSGSLNFKWETVGASLPEPVEPDTTNTTDIESGTLEQEAEHTVSTDVTITNTTVSDPEPDAPDEPGTGSPEFVPEWNGKYENADIGVSVELFWIDSNFVEFQISGTGSVLTATAQIDETAPDSASYAYGEELELSFRLTQAGMIVTQTGASTLLPDSIAGEYLPVPEEAEP